MGTYDNKGSGAAGGGMNSNNPNGTKWTGIVLIVIGVAFLGRNLVPDFPRWLFRWEMILITIGVLVGIRHQFRGAGWFIMVAIGGISLLDVIIPAFNRPQFTWATIAIAIGLYLILKPGTRLDFNSPFSGDTAGSRPPERTSSFDPYTPPAEHAYKEHVNVTSVFGNVKKVVMSKDFRGGEVVVVMGGAEIDLSKSDLTGRVKLEAINIMGGTELIVPPTWHIQSEIVAILGGVEDKRDPHFLRVEPSKVLVLEGVCLLGGIEIKSY
jgi:predicted membrane protein